MHRPVLTGIVLAAGASSRFGSPKLLAEIRGKPILRWSVEKILRAGPGEVIVVVGHQGDAVGAALEGLCVRVVRNGEWAEGMGSSLRAGVAATPNTDAVMIALGDQPGLSDSAIAALLRTHEEKRGRIIVPSYRGERGHPVIFPATVFPELLALRGDRGARDVILRDPGRVERVELDAPVPLDLDTGADLTIVAEQLAGEHAT